MESVAGFKRNDESKVQNLEAQIDRLRSERDKIQQFVEVAKGKGEEIGVDVRSWLIHAEAKIKEEEDFVKNLEAEAKKRCFFGLCPNFKSLNKLDEVAEENAKAILRLIQQANSLKFNNKSNIQDLVSNLAENDDDAIGVYGTESMPIQHYENFSSRRATLEGIMEALKDPDFKIIGVYGMAGVGKTMLVEEVVRKARAESLFDEVAMVTVSRNPNIKQIQGTIADALGLKFDEENVFGRAMRLHQWLKKEDKKVLLVLDDVWKRLDLEEVGIAFDAYQNIAAEEDIGLVMQNISGNAFQKFSAVRLKILLTSTIQEVLFNMKSERNFEVRRLSDSDAIIWFRKLMGGTLMWPAWKIVTGVVENCAGLPVAISAIAKAWKLRGFSAMVEALREETKPIPTKEEKLESVFLTIQMSYSLLKKPELQSLFQLCSLLPQGSDIRVSDLLRYYMGVKLARNVSTVEEARKSVNELKDAGLLHSSENDELVKMHDIVRDVSIQIASEDKRLFFMKDDDYFEELLTQGKLRNCIAISLPFSYIYELPDKLECPRLKLLVLPNKNPSFELPETFFQETTELLVLDLTGMNFPVLPSSFVYLRNLQQLCLDECKLHDMAIIGNLKQLNILRIRSSDLQRLPREVGELTQLKTLDLSNCSKLKVIPANIISSLSNLEELLMRNSFDQWDVEGNARLSELKPLSRLTTLDLHIRSAQVLPAELFSEKLDRYEILIGDVWDWSGKYEKRRILKLKLTDGFHLDRGFTLLLQKTEFLYLDKLKGIKNFLYELDRTGFPQLKNLYIQNGSEIEYIVKSMDVVSVKAFPALESLFLQNLINLEKICQGKLEEECFKRLRILSVKSCGGLKNLFTFSMTKMLLQLQEINVTNCKSIEEIVVEERENSTSAATNNTNFRQLRSLKLQLLPELGSFCSKEKSHSIYQQELVNTRSWLLFNGKVLFPALENLQLSSINIERIWQKKSYCSQNLTSLIIEGCASLKHLFSPSIIKGLSRLKSFEIVDCKHIREIIVTEEVEVEEEDEEEAKKKEMSDKILFPQLNSLKMKNLWNLVGFCSENYFLEFPSLKFLEIDNCPELKEFMHKSLSMSTDITTVNQAVEVNTEKEYQFSKQALFNHKVAFPNLEILKITHLKIVKILWHDLLHRDSFCKLKEMKVGFCNDLLTIFPSNMAGTFRRMKTLVVSNCESLQHIFEIKVLDIKDTNPAVTELRELYIFHLPKLEHVWNKDPRDILTLKNIRLVYVWDCWSLKCLFPASVAEGLQKLEDLIIDCCGLEEVVSVEDGLKQAVYKFVFPQSCSLTLSNLPELKCFFPAVHETEWPKLKKLKTYHCGKENILGIEEHHSSIDRPLILFEKVIPGLEELSLNSMDISIICNHQFPAGLFGRIKVLQVLCYHDKSAVFPFYLLQEFNKLEKLEVICSEFKELFNNQEEASETKPAKILGQIKKLKLDSLPNPRQIWKQNSQDVVPNLETLDVWRCDGLISLGSSSVSFKYLSTLDVWQCKRIENLITSSAARNLVQLIKMRVRECIMMTEVVANWGDDSENEIIFRKLKCLELHYVPNLQRFCSGKYAFQFPSLEQIIVRQCPKLQIFCQGVLSTPELHKVQQSEDDYKGFWAGDLNTTINQLHKNMARYYEPEDLKLHELPELEEIWDKIPQGIMNFRRLKFLEVYNCKNLSYIFTASMALDLSQLQQIKVKYCKAIKEIIKDEGSATQKIILPPLISITLKSCSCLASFYWGTSALECPNLQKITLVDCPNMVAFASTVSKILDIEIIDGGNTKILGQDIPDVSATPFFSDKVSLPVLEDLAIIEMGNLEKIWDDQLEKKSFFKLEHFKVHSCVKLSTVFPLKMLGRLQRLKSLQIMKCASLVEIFEFDLTEAEMNTKLIFPDATYLNLSSLPKLKSFYSRMHTTEWPSLRKMDVCRCDKVEVFALEYPSSQEIQRQSQLVVPAQQPLFWINKATFPCLEELRMECNANMEEIWHGQLLEGYFKLKVLELINFPAQVTVLPSNFFRSLSNLENLAVSDASFNEIFPCEELGGEENQERAPAQLSSLRLLKLHKLTHIWKENFKPGAIFYNLRALEVSDCGKLKILVPSSVSFENLTTLEVSRCQGLKHLIAHSTAKSLVQLTRMSITDCEMIEEIIACSGDEMDPDIFPQLKCLGLSCLPNLASFCSGNYTFKFPLLEIATLRHCPKMKTLSRERFNAPKLRAEYLIDGDEEHWEGDRNTTIQLLFMETVKYRAVEYLVLSDSSKLMEIRNWNPQGILDFKNLKFLKVYKCRNLRYAFNPSMAMDLRHLQKLEIHECQMLEEVVITQGLAKKERTRQKMFPKLVSLLINALPNLARFCSGKYVEFPSLKELWVQSCPMLKTFISSSLTRSNSGQYLHTDLTALFDEKATFPSLEKLGIIDMGNLRKILNDQFSVDSFSKLKVLKLIGLPKQSDILPSCFFFSLSKLEKLVVDDASLIEIFQCERLEKKMQARELADFSDLQLCKLPELTHLSKEFHSQGGTLFRHLKTLKVLECPKLKSLVPSTVCFDNLTTLEISRCHGLINLITPSTAKSMVQLRRMRITDCKKMEEIIANGSDEGQDSIIFPQLEILRLQSLPRLRCFCSGYHHFELPSLVEIIATECPELIVFSEGEISTPLLQRVCLMGEEDRPLVNRDLNTTIKGSHSEQTRNDVQELEFLEWRLSEL